MILDLSLRDMPGSDLLNRIEQDALLDSLPVLVYSRRQLRPDEEQQLRRHTKSTILEVTSSQEYLAGEIAKLLPKMELTPKKVEPELAELQDDVTKELQQVEELLLEQQNELRMFRSKDAVLNRRKILVAGRDRGNVYTLTNVLQEKGLHVLFAENGTETLRQLQSHPEIDLVLMEHVMADMEGGEVMQQIRKESRFAKLPIISLVAKSKPDEYQHCLDAGANDYLFKPVDTDELLSLLRVWLY
jgi:CheY-like chemotaxis protein